MRAFLKRKLLVAGVVVALLGGGAMAVAATRSSSHASREAYLADVARRLGVSTSALESAMKAAGIDSINAAVADGRLTQAQANVLVQRIRAGHGPRWGKLLHASAHNGPRAVAARYLGLTRLELRAQRAAGKSLAEIAAATPGKSAAGLAAAITSARNAKIAAAVSGGRLTQQQAERRRHALTAHVRALLDRTAPPAAGRLHRGG